MAIDCPMIEGSRPVPRVASGSRTSAPASNWPIVPPCDDLVLVKQYGPARAEHGRFGRPPEVRRRTAHGCGPATASAAWPPGLPGDLQRLEGLDRSCSYVTHRRANGGRHVAHRWRKPDLVVRG